ncbi:hypothetical protein P4B35_06545 [Pontiellaceae bacterium B12227]|nr:hypothetical protein [Pontiellaceae bacterium B12227]
MLRYRVAVVLVGVLAGCQTAKKTEMPKAHTITDELVIRVDDGVDDKLKFSLSHHTVFQQKGERESRGKKSEFSVTVEPSVWARVKRSGVLIGYTSATECLLDGEMVEVSGMPGENVCVKVEPLAMDRFRVIGIFLASRMSQSGELGKTIPFDFVAELGNETAVYRKTVVFDPEARLGEEQLLRQP